MLDDAIVRPVAPDGSPDFKSLWAAYRSQKYGAKSRGIEWKFDFSGWLAVWIESGKLNLRGKGKGKYCMSRYGDQGAYEPSNVFIQYTMDNAKQGRELASYVKQETQELGKSTNIVQWLNACFKAHARNTIMEAASKPPRTVKRGYNKAESAA